MTKQVRRHRIYIAGPISKGDLQHNLKQARDATKWLAERGFAPLCPHLTCYLGGDKPEVMAAGISHETFLQMDLAWLEMADACLRLKGESEGADRETKFCEEQGIPVYYKASDLLQARFDGELDWRLVNVDLGESYATAEAAETIPPEVGSQEFLDVLDEIRELHMRNAADYGSDEDPFANIRASRDVGVEPWRGAWMRAKDKVKRIDRFCVKGTLANEGVEDSLIDLAAYSIIALALFREMVDGVSPDGCRELVRL